MGVGFHRLSTNHESAFAPTSNSKGFGFARDKLERDKPPATVKTLIFAWGNCSVRCPQRITAPD